MSEDVLSLDLQSLRGTDSNTLLRLYDLASGIVSRSPSQQERVRADRAIQRIATELRKRDVRL